MKTINNTVEFELEFLGDLLPYEVDYTAEIKSTVGCRDEYGREEIIDDSVIVINDLWMIRENGSTMDIPPNTEQYKDVYDKAWKVIELDIDKQS